MNNIQKKDFRKRYKKIAGSEWFKNTYSNKSLGEILEIEGEQI